MPTSELGASTQRTQVAGELVGTSIELRIREGRVLEAKGLRVGRTTGLGLDEGVQADVTGRVSLRNSKSERSWSFSAWASNGTSDRRVKWIRGDGGEQAAEAARASAVYPDVEEVEVEGGAKLSLGLVMPRARSNLVELVSLSEEMD